MQQPAQLRSAHACSSSEASTSPAELQHKQPFHLPNALLHLPDPSELERWAADMQLQSASMLPTVAYASEQQHMQPNTPLSEDCVYADMLGPMLHMPELSLDSSEHLKEQDAQDDTPQSHQAASNMQATGTYSSFSQRQSQHDLGDASSEMMDSVQSQPDHAAAMGRTQMHWDLPALTPRLSNSTPDQQHELSCFTSGLGDVQPLHTAPADYSYHQDTSQSAHSYSSPMTRPNVIRKTSSDSTIE